MEEKQGIDKFFKARYEKADMNEQWLLPDDTVFASAMEEVNRKRRKKRFLWLLFGLLLLAAPATYILWSSQHNHAPATQSEVRKRNDEEVSIENMKEKDTEKKQGQKPEALSSNGRNRADQTKETGSGSPPRQTNPERKNVHRESKLEIPPPSQHPKIVQQHIPDSSGYRQSRNISTQEVFQLSDPPPVQVSVGELPSVCCQPISYHSNLPTVTTVPESFPQSRSPWQLSLQAGMLWSSFDMSPATHIGQLTEYDKYYLGQFAGLELSKPLGHRWEVNLQLQVDKVNNQSVYRINKQFDMADVSINGNEVRYHSDVDLATPLSNRSQELDMKVDMSSLQDQDILNCVVEADHDLLLLGSGLGLRFAVFQHNRFQTGLEASIDYLWVVHAKESADFKMHHYSDMIYRLNGEFDVKNSTVNGFANCRLGLFARYFWNERLFSGLSLGKDWGLGPVKKSTDAANGSTWLNGFRIGFSTGVRF